MRASPLVDWLVVLGSTAFSKVQLKKIDVLFLPDRGLCETSIYLEAKWSPDCGATIFDP